MKKTIALLFLLTNIIIFGACFSTCFCQEQVQTIQPQRLEGKIVNVGFIGSKIIVKCLQPHGNNDEVTFKITSHTEITKGDLRISLSDLSEGDEITVEYYDDPMFPDAPKAVRIKVKPLI